MVNHSRSITDKYEAIMDDFFTQMASATEAFDQEIKVQTDKLKELVMDAQKDPDFAKAIQVVEQESEQQSKTGAGTSATANLAEMDVAVADFAECDVAQAPKGQQPGTFGGSSARLFD